MFLLPSFPPTFLCVYVAPPSPRVDRDRNTTVCHGVGPRFFFLTGFGAAGVALDYLCCC